METERGWSKAWVGAAAASVVLVAAAFIQHHRHGWPFSLHHLPLARPGEAAEQRERGESALADQRVPIAIDPAQLSRFGVRTEVIQETEISRPLRAVASVVPDESRLSHVHTRVAGWIEQLHVRTTGQTVRAGQALAGIFSQELLATQNEYLAVRKSAAAASSNVLVQSARARLKVFGMTDAEITAIEASGEARRLVTVTAPRSGVVIRRAVTQGTAVDPSTELLTIADLSSVWVLAEVPEVDSPRVSVGQSATIEIPASGRAPFEAKVDFLYPTLTEATRTLRVRFVVANTDGKLRPGNYGSAEFAFSPRRALTVPRDAVVDTGNVQRVFVVEGAGHFTPVVVQLGTRLGDRVEVSSGLRAGQEVVASGVFLVDSESRLRASGGTGHVHGDHGGGAVDHSAHSAPPSPHSAHTASPEPAAPPATTSQGVQKVNVKPKANVAPTAPKRAPSVPPPARSSAEDHSHHAH